MAVLMLRHTLRLLALVTAGLFGLVLVASPAMAGDGGTDGGYPPPPGITVDPENPDPGDTVTVSGEGCEVGATVTISFGGVEVGTTTVGEDGTFSFEFEVPDDSEAGTYEVEVSGCGADVLGTTITVAAAPTTTTIGGTALPQTGSSSTEPLVRTGAVLVAAGAVLVYAMRRRQQATAGR